MKCFYDSAQTKNRYGNYFVASLSLFLMLIGSLGYYVLGSKISSSNFSCHDLLIYIVLLFTFIELIGLVTYIIACTIAKQTRIFYYYSLFFLLGMVISAFGNIYM